uniref:Protein kinase domain-containing protein n=1 Tax=Arundo donax TaxID=35708 RepID=A0A0A9DQQ9_ARUDO
MEPWIGDLGLDRLLSGEATAHRAGASARLFGSKRSMHSTSSLPDLSQMPGPGASPCGSASAATSSAAGAPQPYQAPECLKNLRPNGKWDVYSFGMVLLELLSGRVYSEVELCQWHAGLVAEERGRVLRMADPTLRGEADGREDTLLACFKLAFACCDMAPSKRPAMRDAVMVLERTAAPAAGVLTSSGAIP